MFEPREFIAQGDKVVSLVYAEATVRETGRSFAGHEAQVWTLADGKVARFQNYLDTAAVDAAHVAVLDDHHKSAPREPAFEAPRRDEFPGGPQ